MSRARQIYYYAVLGALGGLLAWMVVGSFPTGTWNIWLAYAFIGSGVGLFIGALVGAVDGLLLARSPWRGLLGAVLGGLTGAVSGLVGLLISGVVFLIFQGGISGRTVSWMLFGLALGIGQGVVARSMRRSSYGAVGGLVAGVLGGLVYETLTQLFLSQSDTVQGIVGGLGMMLIGACLGSLIPISTGLGRALLVVKTGRREGLEVAVIDDVVLGSYDGCRLYLPDDPGVARKHAVVGSRGGRYFIRDLGSGQATMVGRAVLPAGGEQALKKGDNIRLGSTLIELR